MTKKLFAIILIGSALLGLLLPVSANAVVVREVPQRMMPGSVILYDAQLQPRVVQGGYTREDFVPLMDTRTAILKCLKPVEVTSDMTSYERTMTEWENRLVNSFRAQIMEEGIQPTQPYSPTIYPNMKVVYDENDGYISNVYYPDPNEPSGYSIHNTPATGKHVTAVLPMAIPTLGQPYGAHNNVVNFQYADDSFLGVGRATKFDDIKGNRENYPKDLDCATQQNLDYSKVGDKVLRIRNLNTDEAFTFYQADVGALPDAVIDIWGLSNLHMLAGKNEGTSVYPVRYYHKRFSDQPIP